MYKEHQGIEILEDDKKIWRYMDFIKFADIIDRRNLYFPTADRLGDPFDGSFPKAYIDYFNANLDKIFRPEVWGIINREQASKGFSRARKNARKYIAISCWNIQEEESTALWQLYCHGDNGIAIQSTIKRLKNSLKDETRDIYIAKVEYIDHFSKPLSDSLADDFFPKPFMYKGKSFKFENEVRAVIKLPELRRIDEFHEKLISRHNGCDVAIDCDSLIEKVYLSPMSSKWQKKVVKSFLAKYGFNKDVRHSDLKKKPVF